MRGKFIIFLISISNVINLTPIFSEEISVLEQKEPETTSTPEEKMETIQEEIEWLQAEANPMVAIATRLETSVSKAPSIVTVITAEESRI